MLVGRRVKDDLRLEALEHFAHLRRVAAVGEDRDHMIAEAADVLYHLLVLLHARGISLTEVEAELDRRTRQSGLDEKAARKGG